MSPNKKGLLFPAATGLVYTALFFWSFRFCYFWDVIQQVSKEAHWYYLTNFSGSLLIHPLPGIAITPTGYHPPLISMITAVLWKIFGYELWVSHAFTFGCALLLIYHTWKLLRLLLPENRTGGTLLILLLESTVVTQFIIASPDFVLLTAFVISLRAILQNKPVWLSVSLIFLCCANIRGLFTGILLFLSHFYYTFYVIRQKKCSFGECGKLLLPYLPAAGLLLSYFVYYFSHNGWFFSDKDGAYTSHYLLPENGAMILKQLAALLLRSVENGRFVIWLAAAYLLHARIRNTIRLQGEEKMLAVFVLLTGGMYLLFAFVTRMPFSPRYFMIHFFALSLLVIRLLANRWSDKKWRRLFPVILLFLLTGHAWIYPERMSQSWESTLFHTAYYPLREECFNYIEENKINYRDVSSGFCLYGNRGYIEMKNEGKVVRAAGLDTKYFIYSNISNLEDGIIDQLEDTSRWIPIKKFRKGCVFMIIYKNAAACE